MWQPHDRGVHHSRPSGTRHTVDGKLRARSCGKRICDSGWHLPPVKIRMGTATSWRAPGYPAAVPPGSDPKY